jgi:GT2 family glycosyltransferase
MIRKLFAWASWVDGPRRGPAANRNNGAKHARGKWLVFVDDDCRPSPGLLLAYHRAAAEHPEVVCLEGKTLPDRPRLSAREFSPVNETGGAFWSCNVAYSRTVFEQVGGFDEGFLYPIMEDMDLAARVVESGGRTLFVPEAIVTHPWRQASDSFRKRSKSLRRFLAKHPGHRQYFRPATSVKRAAKLWGQGTMAFARMNPSDGVFLWRQSAREILLAVAIALPTSRAT